MHPGSMDIIAGTVITLSTTAIKYSAMSIKRNLAIAIRSRISCAHKVITVNFQQL